MFKNCPTEFGCLEKEVLSWYQPTGGNTDYFNSCSLDSFGLNNFIGNQDPFEGQGYAGMYVYAPRDYREYLTAELSKPLVRGRKYLFSFQVSLAEQSRYGLSEFGVLFTSKALDVRTNRPINVGRSELKGPKNYTIVRNHAFFGNKTSWTAVKGFYVADGSERFITIGNFKTNAKTRLTDTATNLKKVAYYYVDMFSVTPLDGYELDRLYVFENLNFDTNGFKVLGKAKAQLEQLVNYLNEHEGYVISIYGHTDDVGSEQYNQTLSQKRAKSVADYLIAKGLSPDRLIWRGYGHSNPLVENRSAANRGKNRRVEFVLSTKKKDYYASGTYMEDQ